MKRSFIKSVVCTLICAGLATFASFTRADDVVDTSLQAVGQQVENLTNPVGVGVANPRLSWASRSVSKTDIYGKRQSAYQIIVCSSIEGLENEVGDLWDSGKVVSDNSLYVEYAGAPLKTFQHCYWKVRVWDEDDKAGPWSDGG